MFCKNCGHTLQEGSMFCTECGAKTVLPVQSDDPIVTPNQAKIEEVKEVKKQKKAIKEKAPKTKKAKKMPMSLVDTVFVFATVFLLAMLYFNQSNPVKTIQQYYNAVLTKPTSEVWLLYTEDKRHEYGSKDDEQFIADVKWEMGLLAGYGINASDVSKDNVTIIYQSDTVSVARIDLKNNWSALFLLKNVDGKWRIDNHTNLPS